MKITATLNGQVVCTYTSAKGSATKALFEAFMQGALVETDKGVRKEVIRKGGKFYLRDYGFSGTPNPQNPNG